MSDVTLIIGGGLAGVTSFYELLSRGKKCVLLEAEADVARGTSFANGGGLHPSLPDPWNSPGVGRHLATSLFDRHAAMRLDVRQIPDLFGWGLSFLRHSARRRHAAITRANYQLAAYSTAQTDALRQLLNLNYGHASPGTLKLFSSAGEREEALRLADMLAADGLEYQSLSRAQLIEKEPSLHAAHNVSGGLYFPNDGIGDARVFCEQLAAKCEALGGEIRLATKVERLLVENRRIVGVRLATEELRGDVVLCAGVAANKIGKSVRLDLPIRPAKGYSLTFDRAETSAALPTHAMVDPTTHISVTPLGERLRILGMAEFVGHDARIRPERLALLQRFFERLFPDAAAHIDWSKAHGWAGLRPMSADGRPFIGPSKIDGLWLNCGHGHLGWTKAVGSARILADLMTGKKPEINALPFSPNAAERGLR